MANLMRKTKYSKTKEILKNDHYVAIAHNFKKDDAAAATEDGKKIVKAGTIYPTNDASAVGVVLYDVDVTDADRAGALVVHGFIDKTKIPAEPNEAVVLPMVKFV